MRRKVFELGDDQAESFDRLADEFQETHVGVFRNGCRLLREAARAAKSGGRIAIVGPTGEVSPILGPWTDLEPATK